jgi:hypothetical protein
VVADAVAVEPVSTLQFPANREKNREFNKIRASGAAEIVNNAVVTGLPVLIPYSAEQGIILADQGILDCTLGGKQGLGCWIDSLVGVLKHT